jgi:hypothetical protein
MLQLLKGQGYTREAACVGDIDSSSLAVALRDYGAAAFRHLLPSTVRIPTVVAVAFDRAYRRSREFGDFGGALKKEWTDRAIGTDGNEDRRRSPWYKMKVGRDVTVGRAGVPRYASRC